MLSFIQTQLILSEIIAVSLELAIDWFVIAPKNDALCYSIFKIIHHWDLCQDF